MSVPPAPRRCSPQPRDRQGRERSAGGPPCCRRAACRTGSAGRVGRDRPAGSPPRPACASAARQAVPTTALAELRAALEDSTVARRRRTDRRRDAARRAELSSRKEGRAVQRLQCALPPVQSDDLHAMPRRCARLGPGVAEQLRAVPEDRGTSYRAGGSARDDDPACAVSTQAAMPTAAARSLAQ